MDLMQNKFIIVSTEYYSYPEIFCTFTDPVSVVFVSFRTVVSILKIHTSYIYQGNDLCSMSSSSIFLIRKPITLIRYDHSKCDQNRIKNDRKTLDHISHRD